MGPVKTDYDYEKIELKVAQMLQWGTGVAALILSISLLALLFQWSWPDSYAFFGLQFTERLAYAGLALLVSLPMFRVVTTMVLFAIHREKAMALIAAVVLGLLSLSLILGLIH